MLKKVMTVAAVLVLLTLLAAPLVMAQATQDAQPSSSQPPAPTATLPTLDNPYSFDANGNIVIDCGVAFSNFARLELVSDQFAEDPQFQSELEQAQDLAQICVTEGYDPTSGSQPPAGNGMDQYQPST